MKKRPKSGLEKALFGRIAREVEAASPKLALDRAAGLRSRLFRQQLDFIQDPDQFKALLCPRRAGKTYAAAIYILTLALERPGSSSVFITMTRGMAKRIIWGTLKKLDQEFELGIKWHNTDLSGTLANGSTFVLGGADTAADIDKYRGVPFDLIIIDEGKSFPAHVLDELIEEVLTPCLADRAGRLVIMGTPGSILAGTFFAATGPEAHLVKDAEDGRRHDTREGGRYAISRRWRDRELPELAGVPYLWSFHSWTTRDNEGNPQLWEHALQMKRRNGWSDENPIWLREYLGQWIADDGGKVYRYDPTRYPCAWTPEPSDKSPHGLPEGHEWQFLLGMDFGFDDPTSFEVAAWSETCETMYHVHDEAHEQLTVSAVVEHIRELEARFGGFAAIVGDRAGQAKMIFEEIASRHGITIIASDKHQKNDYIDLLNSDLVEGHVKILADSMLAQEMMMLSWDETGRKEDRSTPNHRADGWLYLWRYAYQHFSKARSPELQPGTPEYLEAAAQESIRRLREEYQRRDEERQAESETWAVGDVWSG